MQKRKYMGVTVVLLIVLVGGAFVGLAAAHGESGGNTDDTREMIHANEECEMSPDNADYPMMERGMMGMGDDCPLEQSGGMKGMHGDESSSHHDCPMH